jgi:hypothetical protein
MTTLLHISSNTVCSETGSDGIGDILVFSG